MEACQGIRPGGPTFLIPAASSASPGTLSATRVGGDVSFEFYNQGTVDAWIGYGMTSTAAQTNAVIPINGTPTNAFVVPQGCVITRTLRGNLFFSGITASSSASVFAMPGDGV